MLGKSKIILITGPARSGKSEWAENLALASNLNVIYIATSIDNAQDLEWQQRISQHRQRRPKDWKTWEIPVDLTTGINQADANHCLLIDSLGNWVANLINQDETTWQESQTELINSLTKTSGKIIIVAEETGWGVIPAYPIGRSFRDRLGSLVRKIAAISESFYLVIGGYPVNISDLAKPMSN